MKIRNFFDYLRKTPKPTKEEKDKEWKQVAEEHKVDFETDNSTDLRHPDP
jgi:hypothetical protein